MADKDMYKGFASELHRDLVADLDAFITEHLRRPRLEAGVDTVEWAMADFLSRNEDDAEVRKVLAKHGLSREPAPAAAVGSKVRYVIANPDWEFFPTLADWTDRVRAAGPRVTPGGIRPQIVGQSYYSELFKLNFMSGGTMHMGPRTVYGSSPVIPVFSMQVVAKCKDGFVADIDDPTGILGDIRKDAKAYVEMTPENRDLEASRKAGPYPVIDGAVLFEALEARVCSRPNLELIGALDRERYRDGTEKPVFSCSHEESGVSVGDGSFSFTVKEIDEELSSRESRALGNYSYDDIAVAANSLYMDLDPGDEVPHQKVLSRLCNTVEVMVSEREAALAERCAKDGFLEEPFRRALEREQEVMEECRRMKGFRFKSISRDAFVGSADGWDVVVRLPRKEGQDKHIAFVHRDDGHTEGYQHAVRHYPEMDGVLTKALEQAQRRDRNIRRLEKFGLSALVRGNDKSRKIR